MSETTKHHARVIWRGDKRDLRAHEIKLADQTIAGSSAVDRGGDPTKADPEELFVASLSACHMLWFLDFARRERLRVLSYEDDPVGTMDGKRFLDVEANYRLVQVAASRIVPIEGALRGVRRQVRSECPMAAAARRRTPTPNSSATR
jgi:organic hydroperoxide reductase OsmC/OhrA